MTYTINRTEQLINDVNTAVEWWQDYQEDDTAGLDLVPMDCIADAMAYRQNNIQDYIKDICEELGFIPDSGDLERIQDDIFHFHIQSRTDHIFSSFNHKEQLFIDSWPIQEHHTQFTLDDAEHGRITEGRLKAIERHIEAVISSYRTCGDQVVELDLCWPTDAVWTFYVGREDIKTRIIEDYLQEVV